MSACVVEAAGRPHPMIMLTGPNPILMLTALPRPHTDLHRPIILDRTLMPTRIIRRIMAVIRRTMVVRP